MFTELNKINRKNDFYLLKSPMCIIKTICIVIQIQCL